MLILLLLPLHYSDCMWKWSSRPLGRSFWLWTCWLLTLQALPLIKTCSKQAVNISCFGVLPLIHKQGQALSLNMTEWFVSPRGAQRGMTHIDNGGICMRRHRRPTNSRSGRWHEGRPGRVGGGGGALTRAEEMIVEEEEVVKEHFSGLAVAACHRWRRQGPVEVSGHTSAAFIHGLTHTGKYLFFHVLRFYLFYLILQNYCNSVLDSYLLVTFPPAWCFMVMKEKTNPSLNVLSAVITVKTTTKSIS